jgi:predicted secreted acid phosphatase
MEKRVALKAFTISNLVKEGFLPQDRVSNDESVLLRGTVGQDGQMLEGWDSADKSARRASVSSDYRIALIMGDDLNDFIHSDGRTAEVAEATELSSSRWGRSWIMLPNPVYGSWERRLYRCQDAPSQGGSFEAKLKSLHSWR